MQKKLSDTLEILQPSATLKVAQECSELREKGVTVYSLGAGEPDFEINKVIKDAAIRAVEEGNSKYTAVQGIYELRSAVSDYYKKEYSLNYAPADIIISSGAKNSLYIALRALLSHGDEVIIPIPSWVSYTEMAKIAGGVPVPVYTQKSNAFKMTADELKKVITGKSKVLMLNNPSNPCGSVYTKNELAEIARVCLENGVYILSDEIYAKFLYENSEFCPVASLSEEIKDITITVSGMSKTYAMPGWRLGYAMSSSGIIKAMNTIQGQTVAHPSNISQIAGAAAMRADQKFVEDMIAEYAERRRYVLSVLPGIKGISFIKPYGAFYVLIDVSAFFGKEAEGITVNSAQDFASGLLKCKRVAVIPGEGFGIGDYIRISYASSREEIKNGLAGIREFTEMFDL